MRDATGRLGTTGLLAIGLVFSIASGAFAGNITLQSKSLTDILGSSPTAVGTFLTTNMSAGKLKVDTFSQAYTNNNGLYVYLYQVNNIGTTGNSPVEQFTLAPFTNVTDVADIGYLGGASPSGFLDAGTVPETGAYIDPDSGPLVSFYYNLRYGSGVHIGQHSVVMYVVSSLSPDRITGNVIDGSVGSGDVVGPIPEPASLTLLALTAVGMMRRWKR